MLKVWKSCCFSWVRKDPELKVAILFKSLKHWETTALKRELYLKIQRFPQMIRASITRVGQADNSVGLDRR